MEEKNQRINRRSRRRGGVRGRGRGNTWLLPFLLFLLLAAGAGGYVYVKKYMPVSTPADLEAYFGVSGEDAAIYLNEEKQLEDSEPVKAVLRNGGVYLPYEWVFSNLNRRFFEAEDTNQIFYTLPSETVKISEGDVLSDGKTAFLRESDTLYLNVDLVKQYTDIRYQAYMEDANKRIFVFSSWEPYAQASLKSAESVRLLGGVKSEVLTRLEKGASVRVLNSMEKWSMVSTEDGFIGYVRNRKLGAATEVTPQSDFAAPDYTHILRTDGSKVVLGFHQISNVDSNQNFTLMTQNISGMNVIAPTWFRIASQDGQLVSLASEAYVAAAHEKGYQIWATVNNFDISGVDISALLADTSARETLAAGLVSNAQQLGIEGINVDLELVPESSGRNYVQFMREMSAACRNAGLILSVDMYVPYEFNSYYDLEELGAYCDYVVIMCYDEHYAGSEEAGSVASIGYVERGISETLKKVSPEQTIIAVPFYTRVWVTRDGKLSSDAMSAVSAAEWAVQKGVSLSWDDTTGQNYGEITDATDGNAKKQVWMEDDASLTLKLQRIREAGVAGVAAWKIGQEPVSFWSIMDLNAGSGA